MGVERIDDASDPRLADYRGLTDVALRRVLEPAGGLYMAESAKVLERALNAGHEPRSVLTAEKWLPVVARLLADRPDVPVYLVPDDVAEAVTGYTVHRGMLAAMHRPVDRPVAEVLRGARLVLVLEDIVDHTNVECSKPPQASDRSSDTSGPGQREVAISKVDDTFELNVGVADGQERRRNTVPGESLGDRDARSASITKRRSRIAIFENIVDHTNLGAAFRSAAAIGVDAVLVTPSCADPLYRRSIRVSMGTVFQVPWARIESWPADIDLIKEHGYVVAGMTLGDGAITLDELVAEDHPHLALVFGTEGHGLTRQADRQLDRRVTIPMMHGVDSLNVAASAAVAFYATR